jgi:hypothetical protein
VLLGNPEPVENLLELGLMVVLVAGLRTHGGIVPNRAAFGKRNGFQGCDGYP